LQTFARHEDRRARLSQTGLDRVPACQTLNRMWQMSPSRTT